MAQARFAKGLRRGSTKSETYSTLATKKNGRVQIIKDRVYDITNPQTDAQMLQRVAFATVTSAAAKMYDIISISQEGETKPEYARQAFISQNVELLKKAAYARVGLNRHLRAVFAPKGNQQLIPNSYQVSKGSLEVPAYLVPKTAATGEESGEGGASFEYFMSDYFCKEAGNPIMGELEIGQSYNAEQLWGILFGLMPGDQLTFPQIWGQGVAQALYEGEDESSEIVDKTLNTVFCAPRLVLLSSMPSTTVTVSANTTAAQIAAVLKGGINNDATYGAIVTHIESALAIDEVADNKIPLKLESTYVHVFGVSDLSDANCRALGVILSRLDSTTGKWKYSTSNLVCCWDWLSANDGDFYFGFEIDNAIATYKSGVKMAGDGNFLQRGGTPDIVPASFG